MPSILATGSAVGSMTTSISSVNLFIITYYDRRDWYALWKWRDFFAWCYDSWCDSKFLQCIRLANHIEKERKPHCISFLIELYSLETKFLLLKIGTCQSVLDPFNILSLLVLLTKLFNWLNLITSNNVPVNCSKLEQ